MLFLCKRCASPYYIVIDGKATPLEEVWDTLPKSTSRCGQCGKGSTVGVETVNVGSTYFHYESEEAKKFGVFGLLPNQYIMVKEKVDDAKEIVENVNAFLKEEKGKKGSVKPIDPILVIYRQGKHENKLLSVLDEEFGKREYESPQVFFNSDKAYELRVVTPDVVVTIHGKCTYKGEKTERTIVTVCSNLFPPERGRSNRRLALVGLDTTHGEGATLECFGERMAGGHLPADFQQEYEKLKEERES